MPGNEGTDPGCLDVEEVGDAALLVESRQERGKVSYLFEVKPVTVSTHLKRENLLLDCEPLQGP